MSKMKFQKYFPFSNFNHFSSYVGTVFMPFFKKQRKSPSGCSAYAYKYINIRGINITKQLKNIGIYM